MNPAASLILGALAADAACLGVHWLYDPARVAEIEARGGCLFLDPRAENYAGCRGTFVHGMKRAGELSGYGECCALMLRHLAEQGGRLAVPAYQDLFRQHFGPGGAYVGYIDRPTRLTLARLLPCAGPADFPQPSGVDDDQLPALATLPAVLAAGLARGAGEAEVLAEARAAARVTHVEPLAEAAADLAGRLLWRVLAGMALPAAAARAAAEAPPALAEACRAAVAWGRLDAVAAGQRFGRACPLAQGLPLILHILAHAADYAEAVRANALAGGDSCGRAILVGAAFAARDGVPLAWLARLARLREAADELAALGLA
jgi:ADP-ribosylglycohydrolase